MTASAQRIAINIGSGYFPGLDVVVAGATLAANELGVELVGIRDGYDGLLYPERYPGGGMVSLSPEIVEADGHGGSLLGTAARTDPFNVRTLNDENSVEEVDRSGDVLEALNAAGIDGMLISSRGTSTSIS